MNFLEEHESINADLLSVLDGRSVYYQGKKIPALIFTKSELSAFQDSMVEGTTKAVQVKTDDISGIEHDSVITIEHVDYVVIGIQPDEFGMTLLNLTRA